MVDGVVVGAGSNQLVGRNNSGPQERRAANGAPGDNLLNNQNFLKAAGCAYLATVVYPLVNLCIGYASGDEAVIQSAGRMLYLAGELGTIICALLCVYLSGQGNHGR